MKKFLTTSCVLGLALLNGCQSPLDDSLYKQWSQSQANPNTESVDAGQATVLSSLKTLPTPANLDDLIAYAQLHNPSIKAIRYRIEQNQQTIPQVTSLDDPMLTIAPVGRMAQTADGEVGLMASLSQKLPLSDKLDVRGQVAQQQVKIAQEQLRQTQLMVTRDVKQVYWSYQLAVQTMDVLKEQRNLMQQFNEAANAAYRAGRSDQQDLLRITVEISTLDNRMSTATQQQQSALARLNALLNRPASAPLTPAPSTDQPEDSSSLQDWQKLAFDNAPQLRVIHLAIEQARKQLKLAHLQRIPDLTVVLNYATVRDGGTSKVANGTDQIYAGLGINLPIWQDKLDAAEKQAVARIRELLMQLVSKNNQLQYAVADSYERVASQRQQDELYRSTILPQAQQVVDSALSQYRTGRGSFLNLIDNWRKLLELELMTHRNHTLWKQDLAMLKYLAATDNN